MPASPDPAPETNTVERVSILVALEAEAMPIVERLMLAEQPAVDPALSGRLFSGTVGTLHVDLLTNGWERRLGVERVGTDAATLAAYIAIRKLAPDLVINAGTCGGFEARGGAVGDVYVSEGEVLYHDRRIPLPGYDRLARGGWGAQPAPGLAAAMGAKTGVVSTGNSLDFLEHEAEFFERESVCAKDMEACAIAQVCAHCGVPFMAVKAVTDLVDHPEPVQDVFLRNLRTVSVLLAERMDAGIRWLGAHPRRLADL